MDIKIIDLILSTDLDSSENEERNYDNGSTDVIVIVEESISLQAAVPVKYVASFFSYRYIENLQQKYQETGEFLNGQFFHVTNMVLINNCSKKNVSTVVSHLIDEGEFYQVFRKLKN